MTKLYSLFARRTTDTEVKAVEINQIIQLEGYNYDKYVVYKITHNNYGYTYHSINLRTLVFDQSEIIKPLSQKFGIGMYYDDNNIVFKTDEEVARLLAQAQEKRANEMEQSRAEEKCREAVKVIGREWLRNNLPSDTQAIIVGRLKQDESDSQTDYYASSTSKTVILGFSTHKRDIFSEMRKCASNFADTAYLAEYNEEYEHREKYSMGAGYYLGESKYYGWIIEKEPIGTRERAIEEYSYIAGCQDRIFIKGITPTKEDTKQPAVQTIQSDNLSFEIVDYSKKSIAVFGDTKVIKDLLYAMGGSFNPRLTHNEEKQAGWIFPKTKREQLERVLNLKSN